MEPKDHADVLPSGNGGQAGTVGEATPPGNADPLPASTVAATAPQGTGELPKIVLVQAGLAVFNGVMGVIYLGLWLFSDELLFQILQRAAGFSLLLGLAPILLGSYILHLNKRSGTQMPGTRYAVVGVWVGVLLCMMTVTFPMLVTLRSLFATPNVS